MDSRRKGYNKRYVFDIIYYKPYHLNRKNINLNIHIHFLFMHRMYHFWILFPTNTPAIQYVKFNSVPIDPTSDFSFKNQASPKPKPKENGHSANISNGSVSNDSKSKR